MAMLQQILRKQHNGSVDCVWNVMAHGQKQHNGSVDCVWNVMAHGQKQDFVFWRNKRVHLNRRGRQFNRLLVAEVCASAVVMLVTPCSEVVWRVLATHYIHQFPLQFPSRASPCAITFQLHSTMILLDICFGGRPTIPSLINLLKPSGFYTCHQV
jgi:hypothetical protein